MKFSFPVASKFREKQTKTCRHSLIREISPFLNPRLLKKIKQPSFTEETRLTLESVQIINEEQDTLTQSQKMIERLYPQKLKSRPTIGSKHQRQQAVIKHQLDKVLQSNQVIKETISQFRSLSLSKPKASTVSSPRSVILNFACNSSVQEQTDFASYRSS